MILHTTYNGNLVPLINIDYITDIKNKSYVSYYIIYLKSKNEILVEASKQDFANLKLDRDEIRRKLNTLIV